jgi:hypothetical protein
VKIGDVGVTIKHAILDRNLIKFESFKDNPSILYYNSSAEFQISKKSPRIKCHNKIGKSLLKSGGDYLEFSVTCHTFSFPGGKCHGSVQGTLRDHAKEIMRSIDLCQKILFVCRDSDDIVYNQQQVQKMFLRSMQTGLTSEVIRNELKHLLNDSDIEDEALLEKINVATHFEEERAAKQSISIRPGPRQQR